MGYVLRVRLASFFTGAAVASAAGLYYLHKDYKAAHESISEQANRLYESLDGRISAVEKVNELVDGSVLAVEKFKEIEEMKQADAAS